MWNIVRTNKWYLVFCLGSLFIAKNVSGATDSQCELPAASNGSSYSIEGCENCPKTGLVNEKTVLINHCEPGYILPDNLDVSVCLKGTWRPAPPSCIKLCPPLVNPTRKIECRFGDKLVSCTEQVRPKTKALVQCADHYYPHFAGISFLRLQCLDSGAWNSETYDCRAECGVHTIAYLTPNKTNILENAPWYGIIYKLNNGELTEHCAGTMISRDVMMTAAHCVYDERSKDVRDKTNLRVILGKHVNDLGVTDSYQNEYDVKRIAVHDNYIGASNNYANDIALLDLKEIYILGRYPTPACVDWDDKEDSLIPGQPGTVPGWAMPANEPNERFNISHLSYITENECIESIAQSSKLLTQDKFCAKDDGKWRNLTSESPFWDQFKRFNAIIRPNSEFANVLKNKTAKVRVLPGAGITFVKNRLHFVRGVRSVIRPTGDGTFVFTSVNKNLDWYYLTKSSVQQFHEEKTYNINFKDCGKIDPKSSSSGEDHLDTPWAAMIIEKGSYICGGTIISPHIVITESQCVRNPVNYDPVQASALQVAVGKRVLNLLFHEPMEQIFNVEQVIIRRRLQELNLFYEEDVAILELSTNIKFSDQIRPVCIDWRGNGIKHKADSLKMKAPELVQKELTTNEYRSVNQKWVPDDVCLPLVADFERSRYTENVFCTVFNPNQLNVSSPQRWLSNGEGLTVEVDGRHYLYGLRHYVNQNPESQWHTLYTNISTHIPWLETHRLSLEYDRNFQNCGKANPKVALISFGKNASQVEHPWHVGLFYKTKDGYILQCGGTLVHPKIVLTAAHCVFLKKLVEPSALRVVVGKVHSSWSVTDPNEQRLEVYSIIVPTSYFGSAGTFRDDIALLNLTQPVTVTDHVLPACLPKNKDSVPIGTEGNVVGWGFTENLTTSDVLQLATLPTISLVTCINMAPQSFKKFISGDKMCALYVNETGPQEGDSGGGLTFEVNGRYFVHGVVSVKPPKENKFGAFTNVIAHFEWIREKTSELIVN